MQKNRAQFLSTVFLFAAGASGTVFAVGNKNYAVSRSVGDLVLHGVEFIKLGAIKFGGFSVFEHKNISLYNVYIVLFINKHLYAVLRLHLIRHLPLKGKVFGQKCTDRNIFRTNVRFFNANLLILK